MYTFHISDFKFTAIYGTCGGQVIFKTNDDMHNVYRLFFGVCLFCLVQVNYESVSHFDK